jgi:hypothetical protein
VRDREALAALAACFAALTALTWRKWGVPEIDAGAELTTADLVKHGALAYRDVRYWYGPLGLYSLALAFKLLGTSFTTAYAFGLAQTAAIAGAFYALARQWLAPLSAGLASAMVLAIGFSGTAFNFVLPHTDSATFGLLFLLLTLLCLTRGRLLGAGAMAGLTGLTRPEFYGVAVGALGAYALVTYRCEGRGRAGRAAWRLALPALAIPAAVLGWFAWRVGASTLVSENLWPAKFIAVGAKTERNWMPFTASSLAGLALRAAIYVGVVGALVKGAEAFRASRSAGGAEGASRSAGGAGGAALWPLLAVALALAGTDGVLRASGALSGQRAAIELEARHLMLGMSWLPALGLGMAAVAAVRLVRRDDSPLGGSWPADAALMVVATALGLRAYNAFTTEASYAPYYAPPLVLVLAIAHARLAERRPAARGVAIGALGLLAVGFSAYALGGLYRHDDTAVRTPRGTFVTSAAAALALQGAVRAIDASTRPGERILAAPLDGGLYFMSDRRPALRELSLLPALLVGRGEEEDAVMRLRGERVTLAVIGARDFSPWGTPRFGVDYAPLLGIYLRGAAMSSMRIGTLKNPVGGTTPSHGFMVMRLGLSPIRRIPGGRSRLSNPELVRRGQAAISICGGGSIRRNSTGSRWLACQNSRPTTSPVAGSSSRSPESVSSPTAVLGS